MILLLALAMFLAHLGDLGILLLLLPAVILVRQILRLDINDPARCLALFKSNREVGLAVAAAILLGQV
jgi:4-hydroxybenzoate polyprenyltransferase